MVLNIVLLVTALSVDVFIGCAAYGANGIEVSAKQLAVMNGICGLCLAFSLLFGILLESRIPEKFMREAGFFSLLFLGCVKLADSSIRSYLRRHRSMQKNLSFGFSRLHFIVSIYSDPLEADADRDRSLSWRELSAFAFALSIDCLISGTAASFLKIPVLQTTAALFAVGEGAAYLGLWLGRKIRSRCPMDVSWVSGLFFLILALTKR